MTSNIIGPLTESVYLEFSESILCFSTRNDVSIKLKAMYVLYLPEENYICSNNQFLLTSTDLDNKYVSIYSVLLGLHNFLFSFQQQAISDVNSLQCS